MGLEVEVTSFSKNKGEKNVFRVERFYNRLHLSLRITNGFIGLDFEANNPRIKAELRVMMAEL